MMRRIQREAALLQAVSQDDAEEVEAAMGMEEQQELLMLKVKPTFNDPKDATAFFHSIASYGMEFGLNENITQLAQRNEKMVAFQVLNELEKKLGLGKAPRDLDLEAALLTAVAKDEGAEVLRLLSTSTEGDALLNLQVKETYKDADDRTAFYHSVASHGLTFELGDTLQGLAVRNNRPAAAQSLLTFSTPPDTPVEVLVTNAVNGQELCRVSARSSWTILQVAQEVSSKAPTAGCRMFMLGDAALTTGTILADLNREGDLLELSSLVRSNVEGLYNAQVLPGENELETMMAREFRPRRMGRIPPRNMQLDLKTDGTATFDYSARPVDHGHCAPPSGGFLLSGQGHWAFHAPGIKVTISSGDVGHFSRCIPSRDGKMKHKLVMTMALVKKDQLDVASFVEERDTDGFHNRAQCPVGTAFVKGPATEGGRRLVTFR